MALRRPLLNSISSGFFSHSFAARSFNWPPLLGRLVDRHPGSECDAAAAGHVGMSDRVGVSDDRTHIFGRHAEDFGRDHRHCGARPADIDRSGDHAHRAVVVDVDGRRRLQAAVEPESGGDSASAMDFPSIGERNTELFFIASRVSMKPICLYCGPAGCGVPSCAALRMRKSTGSMPHAAPVRRSPFRRQTPSWRSRSAIGRHLGSVDHDIVRIDFQIFDFIRTRHTSRPERTANRGMRLLRTPSRTAPR